MKSRMKLLKKFALILAVLVMLTVFAAPYAVGQEYTYTVRIYAGQQGTIVGGEGRVANSGEMLVCEGLEYGDRIDFHNNMVSLNDGSKYYIKGIRQSGKGTDEISETGNSSRTASFVVTKDQDFVVAYGVLTEPVQYTINYRSASGQELAPSETYYGNVGDRPVIAYQYVEGYQPQAYNLTKTLSADPTENIFTFIYTPLPKNTVYTNTTTTVVSEADPSSTTPNDTSSTTTGESSEVESSSSSAAESQPDETDLPDNDVPEAQPEAREPVNTWDLDDGDVPLANFEDHEDADELQRLSSDGQLFWNNIPLAAKIAGGVVMLGGFSTALWLLIFRRRRKDEQ